MAYTIGVRSSALRSLSAIPKPFRDRLAEKIDALAAEPRPSGAVKLRMPGNLYRIRVSDYRVIYQIDDARCHVEVAVVAHRRDVYRGL